MYERSCICLILLIMQLSGISSRDYRCGTVQCYNTPGNWPVIGWAPKARTRNFWVWENGVAIQVKCE